MKNIRLIGTSHISKESILKVEQAISQFKPDIVALELDRNRYHALQDREAKGRFSFRDIWKIGLKGFLFALIGSYVTKKLADKIGTEPGADMLAAIHIAKAKELKIALIDQDIQITLRNFSRTFSWKEKGRIFVDIFNAVILRKTDFYFDVRKIPDEKTIVALLKKVKARYPNVYRSLIDDRNRYMAKRLASLMKQNPDKKIVAVIGAGHEKEMLELIKVLMG